MKNSRIVFLLFALSLLPFGAGAQVAGSHSVEADWASSLPLGSDAFQRCISFTPVSLRWEYRVADKWGLGLSVGYDDHSETGRYTHDRVNGDYLSGMSDRQFKQLPLFATVRWYMLGGRESLFRPYLGVGLGAMWSQQYLTGAVINTTQSERWGFAAAPEIGTRLHPCRKSGFFIDFRCTFRYATNRWDSIEQRGIASLNAGAGLGWMF